jgi:hypothetical protein
MICFARLREDDVITIARTGDDPRRYLSRLKAEVGPIREVTWLFDEDPPQGWYDFRTRFGYHYLYIEGYRSEPGPAIGLLRADPQLLKFLATLDPATATHSTAAASAVWRARQRAARDALRKATAEVFGQAEGDDGQAAQHRFNDRLDFLIDKKIQGGLSEDETAELDQLEDQRHRWRAAFQRHRSSVERPSLATVGASDAGRSDHPGDEEGGAGTIYFALLESGGIKIGFTTNLQQRLQALRREYKGPVNVLATFPGDVREEQRFHREFSHLRAGRTEQFAPTGELMEFLRQLAVRPLPRRRNPGDITVWNLMHRFPARRKAAGE